MVRNPRSWILAAAIMCSGVWALGDGAAPDATGSGTIVVSIDGFRNATGHARVALFDREHGFPGREPAALRTAVADIRDAQSLVRFEGLPFGEYAVSMYHDENGDGRLNKNLFGVPREGYGVSNNVVHKMRSAGFPEAKFALRGEVEPVSIHVHY